MPGDYCYPKDDHGLSSAELIQLKADCSTAISQDPSSSRRRREEKERCPRAATAQMAGGSPREEDGRKQRRVAAMGAEGVGKFLVVAAAGNGRAARIIRNMESAA